jgi:long-chain acyl-CoA synthetase
MPTAEILWSADGPDRRALALREDWSALEGLEQLWPALAARLGAAVALEAPHARPRESITYSELHQRIEAAAAGFTALGVAPGEVAALFAENGPRWLQADQGLMRAGAADAVRGSAAPLEELRYILRDSGAIGLVVESSALLDKLALEPEQRARLRFVVVLEGNPPAAAESDLRALPADALDPWLSTAQRADQRGAEGARGPQQR